MVRSKRISRWMASLAVALALFATSNAGAFSPIGGTSLFTLDIQVIRWALQDFDDDLNGDVRPGEGLPITIEKGPAGFTNAEEALLKQAFDVWQNVDSAYAAFKYTLPVTDALALVGTGGSIFQIDGLNLMALQTANDPPEVINTVLSFPVLAITLTSFTIEDGFLEAPDGTVFPISGGRIIESDVLFDAASVRSPAVGVPPVTDLLGVAVHEFGHLLGLGHSPLENFELDPVLGPIETAVWAERDASNVLTSRGVTPTMFPAVFLTDDGTGATVLGQRDLAPDDIAGLNYLYPRRNGQGNYFTVRQFARTQSRGQIPSLPLLGGFVTAYADVDNDPNTPRVPFLGTLTGLLEPNIELQQRGDFELSGIPKELEHFGFSEPFQATYTFTIEPLTAARFPFSVVGVTANPLPFDNTHNRRAEDGWSVPYDAFFPSEVFNVAGELFGAENFDAGTPLAWDPIRRRIIDAESKTPFDRLLPLSTPMFGDKSEVCPLNVAIIDTAIVALPMTMRDFRDEVLMAYPLGAAFVDSYYAAGPSMAMYLNRHALALDAVQAVLLALEWMLVNADLLLALSLIGWVLSRYRRRHVAVGLILFAGALWSLAGQEAHAAIANVSDEEMVALSDQVIEGVVTNVESTLVNQRPRVVTTVTIQVVDTLKGRLDKGGFIFIELPVGRVGEFITASEELPTYVTGDRATFFLRDVELGGLSIVGGIRGSRGIVGGKDADGNDTGIDAVVAGPFEQEAVYTKLEEKGYAVDKSLADADSIPLEVYKTFIREVAREQRQARRN